MRESSHRSEVPSSRCLGAQNLHGVRVDALMGWTSPPLTKEAEIGDFAVGWSEYGDGGSTLPRSEESLITRRTTIKTVSEVNKRGSISIYLGGAVKPSKTAPPGLPTVRQEGWMS